MCVTLNLSVSLQANDLTLFRTIRNTDFKSVGAGGRRSIGRGTLFLSDVTGAVAEAYLYWHGPMNSPDPNANAYGKMATR